jgi:predicted nucleic acid-binding protein
MLLDSNIIIYATQPENQSLREFVARHTPAVSAVSYVDVLGYHKLTHTDETKLAAFFAATIVLPVDDAVIRRATELRRQRKMSLGDALISATALIHGRRLVTRNVKDFAWRTGLTVIDPFAPLPPA